MSAHIVRNNLGSSLAIAVVASSHSPVLLLDEDRVVVTASAAFCEAFEIDPATIEGQEFASLGKGEWAIAQLQSLLQATASGLAEVKEYEFELKRKDRGTRCLVLNAHKLDYGEDGAVRLLLAFTDITEARSDRIRHEAVVREKNMLLQELQHRVANSLQIIASVLMQSARKVQSDEARGHLQDAHYRVMSIASMQKLLGVTSVDRVSLRPYLKQLCDSISASMIHDRDQLQLSAESDDSTVDANVSISLGLVVTELVINALKHAFPGGRAGIIAVDYRRDGPNWTLSIADNGVGMPTGDDKAKAGLGTNLVQALARQLDATITVRDNEPGTAVSLDHVKPAGDSGADREEAHAAV